MYIYIYNFDEKYSTKTIPNHCTLNKIQHQTCTSIPLANCYIQPVKNYWFAIANLVQILELNVLLNHAIL